MAFVAEYLRRLAEYGRAGIPIWDILDQMADDVEEALEDAGPRGEES